MSTLCFHGETIGFNDHRYKDVKRHRSFHTAFNDKAQDKGLYDGLITSCKALGYFRHMYSRINKTAHFTPIIVLDGTLWSASLSRDSGISIKQVDKLLVDFDYIFGEDKKPSKIQNQIIEVIAEREFQNVVEEIDKDNNVLLKSWVNFLELNKEK